MKKYNSDLLIMLSVAATRLYKNEALCAFDVLWIKCTTLPMFYRQVVHGPVHEFKRRKDLRQLPLDFLEQGLHILELRQCEHDIV